MDRMWKTLTEAAAAVAGIVAGWYGGWTPGSRVLVILMITDYVLGCVCALTGHSAKTETGHFLSKVAFLGLLKKGIIMVVILVAALLDQVLGGTTNGQAMTMFRSAAEFFYIASEGLSIIENAGLMGVPVPKGVRKALEALREKNDEREGRDDNGGE